MLVLLSGLATAGGLSIAQALPASELFEDLNLNELSLQTGGDRTFVSLNSTYIAYGIAAGAVLVLVVAVSLYLYDYYYGTSRSDPVPSSQADYSQYFANQENYNQYLYQQAAENYRSANDGYDYNGLNIIQWISMLQDLYEKFDYNDLDCQKRLICEVMREPDYYGNMAQKFKSGFQYAKYLEVLSLPDDMRELLDEYLDANSRAEQKKACEEFFQCPYSIKDSVKRNLSSNSL